MVSDRDSRGPDWELYAPHREAFTQTVLSAAQGREGGRLCVLGAGKCNDLDLPRLATRFRELHLVDLEPALLASAVSREPPELRKRLRPHAPVDLSLLSPKRASKWHERAPSAQELESVAISTRQGLRTRLPGPFDVVVSACVLTQLGFALGQSFREPHPLLGPLRIAIAHTHVKSLLDLTAPGGTALLVTDLASSSHYPLHELAADADLEQVLREVLQQRAFYHLAQPRLLSDLLNDVAPERPIRRLSPWLWNGPQQRTYLVYGFEISADSRAG
jgi:hypothetical protein